jgi:hypothetical protein
MQHIARYFVLQQHSKGRATPSFQSDSLHFQDVLLSVTNVMFPMYKAFIEPDIQAAKIRIHSSYNPMISMVDPVYSCKVNLSFVPLVDALEFRPI